MKACSLKRAVAFYLQSRRHLGFALKSEGALLENLVEHARQREHRGPLTTRLALDWAQLPPPSGSRQRARRLVAVRHFATFWAAFDPRTQVPPAGLFGSAYGPRGSVHIYTPGQITALLMAALHLSPEGFYNHTFSTLLGLLACTGLRSSEALALELPDWEPRQAVLTIRQSKFGQSRLVPVSVSAAKSLNAYVQARAQAFAPATSQALFLNPRGQPLGYEPVRTRFARLRQQLGWDTYQPRPRLHDLRHTFTVNCLLGWYRQGQQELNAKILSLAVYLGHRNIRHTYWYLSAVPELLALGSARWARALSAQKGAAHA
jgi:integrase/recombinase XerD